MNWVPWSPISVEAIWPAVDRWIERTSAESLSVATYHGLDLVWGTRQAELGAVLPAEIRADWAANSTFDALVCLTLRRVRERVEGPLVLFKGPEVGALYRSPGCRFAADVDIICPEANQVWATLTSEGFQVVGDHRPTHFHLPPLVDPATGIAVELHHDPGWVAVLRPPTVTELIEQAEPSSTEVPGVLALGPAHHAAAVASHILRAGCLARAAEALDLLLCLAAAGDGFADDTERWGMVDLHCRLTTAAQWIFDLGPRPSALWAHLCRHARAATIPRVERPRVRRLVALSSCSSVRHSLRYASREWQHPILGRS